MTDHRNETPKKDKFVTLRKKKKRKGLSFGNELFRLSETLKLIYKNEREQDLNDRKDRHDAEKEKLKQIIQSAESINKIYDDAKKHPFIPKVPDKYPFLEYVQKKLDNETKAPTHMLEDDPEPEILFLIPNQFYKATRYSIKWYELAKGELKKCNDDHQKLDPRRTVAINNAIDWIDRQIESMTEAIQSYRKSDLEAELDAAIKYLEVMKHTDPIGNKTLTAWEVMAVLEMVKKRKVISYINDQHNPFCKKENKIKL